MTAELKVSSPSVFIGDLLLIYNDRFPNAARRVSESTLY